MIICIFLGPADTTKVKGKTKILKTCTLCKKNFTTYFALNTHLNNKHQEALQKQDTRKLFETKVLRTKMTNSISGLIQKAVIKMEKKAEDVDK